MKKDCVNIYKTARNSANFVQSKAATLLNVSSRSLTDYETGKTTPPDDVVIAMIETYKTPWLALSHLKESTLVGNKYLPDIITSDLAKSVLKLKKEINDVIKIDGLLVELACDGIIDPEERARWNEHIAKEVYELFSASFQLIQSV